MHATFYATALLATVLPATCSKPDAAVALDYLEAAPMSRRVQTYVFNEREAALCIVDEGCGRPVYGSLRTAMQRNNCNAGVNGGYFGADAARTPLGLLRHKGHSITPLSTKGFAVSGVLYDTGEGIYLERSNALTHPVGSMQEAVQGGPFLVERGNVVPGLNNTKKARRTFVATDGKGNWCIAVTKALTLQELALMLVECGSLTDFHVETALNLDGGSSTAFWDGTNGRTCTNLKPVRNYVGITPRQKAAKR